MLSEIARVNQPDPKLRRRWFRDDYFDIFTWQAADGSVAGFQLCYDLPNYERVLSWRFGKGYTHYRVDGGEATPVRNRSPIMLPDGLLPLATVLDEFDMRTDEVEPLLRDFLRQHLVAYGVDKPDEIDNPTPGV